MNKTTLNSQKDKHSMLSLRRVTPFATSAAVALPISIHALLAESDQAGLGMSTRLLYFYPRSPCGERHPGQPVRGLPGRISIHALLAESDAVLLHYALHGANFYPRSPCGERHRRQGKRPDELYFYPRSPCGERRPCIRLLSRRPRISIHALLAESDTSMPTISSTRTNFYPRSPCGERRYILIEQSASYYISIHALLAESDGRNRNRMDPCPDFYPRSPCGERLLCFILTTPSYYFYPRSPCGERQVSQHSPSTVHTFLSTLSLRRATRRPWVAGFCVVISIHALLAESDHQGTGRGKRCWYFYPRSPCGERQHAQPAKQFKVLISIHALLAESDEVAKRTTDIRPLFLSTLSLRRATSMAVWVRRISIFLSTLSLRRATNAAKGEDKPITFLSTLSLRRATRLLR